MLDAYRMRMAALGGYEGEARRRNSQKIMDASWMRDAATKPVYVKFVNRGLPVIDDDDEVLYAKFNIKSYYSVQGDNVEYLLQFRLEDMKNNPDIRVGSYVQIHNEAGEPEFWLIVAVDDRTQFRQFYILKCTWVYKWTSLKDGHRVIHECLGCGRKQNSYNSGVWLDYVTASVENQEVFWVPTNEDTQTILYDTRFLKSEAGRMPPLAYKVSKIEDTASRGITRFTMTQEMYDPSRDSVEHMIANYNMSYVEPELPELEENPTVSSLEIAYSGQPAVRAGGGFKKLTLKERVDGQLVDVTGEVHWSVDFSNGDITQLVYPLTGNPGKIKCLNDYSLIGKTFTVTAEYNGHFAKLVVEVVSL